MIPSKIAVLGANGQLGQSLRHWQNHHKTPETEWHFFSSAEIDITDEQNLEELTSQNNFDYVVNCAAYTAVDQAEKEADKARKINTTAIKYLAEFCQQHNICLIHISTDFVFDGSLSRPLREGDQPNPLGVYGKTKYEGEKVISKHLHTHFILRTGWLYSGFRTNFFKTIQKLSRERSELSVVYDQVGTPTHTNVLCRAITRLITTKSSAYGCYHIANEGVASWYDFAYEILNLGQSTTVLKPILTKDFPTLAKRPSYSVLDKTKFKTQFDLQIPHWKEDLKGCFE